MALQRSPLQWLRRRCWCSQRRLARKEERDAKKDEFFRDLNNFGWFYGLVRSFFFFNQKIEKVIGVKKIDDTENLTNRSRSLHIDHM